MARKDESAEWSGVGNLPSVTDEATDTSQLGRDERPPWEFSYQLSDRYVMWTDSMRERFVLSFAAKTLHVPEAEIVVRINRLASMLPDLATKIPSMKADLLAEMCRDTDRIAERLLQLKMSLPTTNLSVMVTNRPSLALSDDLELIATRVEAMRRALPGIKVDLMLADFPALLDLPDIQAALDDVDRVFGQGGNRDVKEMIRGNPNLLLYTQRGDQLIPYDDPSDSCQDDD